MQRSLFLWFFVLFVSVTADAITFTYNPGPTDICQLEVANGVYGDSPFIVGSGPNECAFSDIPSITTKEVHSGNFLVDPITNKWALAILFRPETSRSHLFEILDWRDLKRAEPQSIHSPMSISVQGRFSKIIAGYKALYYDGGDDYNRCVGENCDHYAAGGCDGKGDAHNDTDGLIHRDTIEEDCFQTIRSRHPKGGTSTSSRIQLAPFWHLPAWQDFFISDNFDPEGLRATGEHIFATSPLDKNHWIANNFPTFISPRNEPNERREYCPNGDDENPCYPYAVDVTIDTCGEGTATPPQQAALTISGPGSLDLRDMRIHLKCGWIKFEGCPVVTMRRVEIFVDPKCADCVPQIFEFDNSTCGTVSARRNSPRREPLLVGGNGDDPTARSQDYAEQWPDLRIHPHPFEQRGHARVVNAPKRYIKYNYNTDKTLFVDGKNFVFEANGREELLSSVRDESYRCKPTENDRNKCKFLKPGVDGSRPEHFENVDAYNFDYSMSVYDVVRKDINREWVDVVVSKSFSSDLEERYGDLPWDDDSHRFYDPRTGETMSHIYYPLSTPSVPNSGYYYYKGRPITFLLSMPALIQPSSAPLDLSSLYRHVQVHPSAFCMDNERWDETSETCVCTIERVEGVCIPDCGEGKEWVAQASACLDRCGEGQTRNVLQPEVCMGGMVTNGDDETDSDSADAQSAEDEKEKIQKPDSSRKKEKAPTDPDKDTHVENGGGCSLVSVSDPSRFLAEILPLLFFFMVFRFFQRTRKNFS